MPARAQHFKGWETLSLNPIQERRKQKAGVSTLHTGGPKLLHLFLQMKLTCHKEGYLCTHRSEAGPSCTSHVPDSSPVSLQSALSTVHFPKSQVQLQWLLQPWTPWRGQERQLGLPEHITT